jgi:integrase/recombinase XerD
MYSSKAQLLTTYAAPLPMTITELGVAAEFAYEEALLGRVRNPHTRRAYQQAIHQFLDWLNPIGLSLTSVTPGIAGRYFDDHPGRPATKKLARSALNLLFDALVNRHVLILNPILSIRTEKHQMIEGRTPIITAEQVRQCLDGIDVSTTAGLRDRAIIATLVYTAARCGAVAKLRGKDFRNQGLQRVFLFSEKNGKERSIPVRHDLDEWIHSYLERVPGGQAADLPLFRTIAGRTDRLTEHGVTGLDIWRLLKKRCAAVGLSPEISPHSCRVFTVSNLLAQQVPLEEVQNLCGHADARTTRLYSRVHQGVSRKLVERISF